MEEIFRNIKFPLILGVVFIHCNVFAEIPGDLEIAKTIYYAIIDILSFCVPCFFFISGYLFFREGVLTAPLYNGKLRRRVCTLLTPYLIWNFIAMVVVVANTIFLKGGSVSLYEQIVGFVALPDSYYPHYVPFWYIRDLIVLVIFSPLIFLGIKCLKYWFVVLIVIASIVGTVYNIAGILFFSLGATISLSSFNLENLLKFKYIKYMCLIVACGIVEIILGWNIHVCLWILNTCATILCAFSLFRYIKIPNLLSQTTFFIFAIHGILINFGVRKFVLLILGPSDNLSAILSVFLVYVLAIVVSVAIYYLLKRICPSVLYILCGNRSVK